MAALANRKTLLSPSYWGRMAGRALSALLGRGGWVNKRSEQKREPQTQQELREAALHIWSRHQRLDELLLEVSSSARRAFSLSRGSPASRNGSSERGKSILSSNLGSGASKMSIPEQFIGG
uniref:Uncharacterized protein n=1 Tax=Pseudonaja textilis TaxID=8673 RepID=A0A670YV62_PSETE